VSVIGVVLIVVAVIVLFVLMSGSFGAPGGFRARDSRELDRIAGERDFMSYTPKSGHRRDSRELKKPPTEGDLL